LERLQAHYIFMDDWNRSVTEEENCALISIPSVLMEATADSTVMKDEIFGPIILILHDNQLNRIRYMQLSRDRNGRSMVSNGNKGSDLHYYIDIYIIRVTLHPYPLRPHTNHQYASEYNESTTNRKFSCHSKHNTAPFLRVVQFILGGETTQGIYYSTTTCQTPRRSKVTSPLISWLVVVVGRR